MRERLRLRMRKVVKVLDGQPTGARGQSLVELTLTLPILILMVLGLSELGILANNYLILMDVVRDAARLGVNLDPRINTPYFNPGGPSWTGAAAGDGLRNRVQLTCASDKTQVLPNTLYHPNTNYGDQPADSNPLHYTDFTNPAMMAYPHDPLISPPYSWMINTLPDNNNFFEAVMCHALGIMSPLRFDDGVSGLDEIVISAVSYDKRNVGGTDTLQVTGRWPLENRWCHTGSGAGLAGAPPAPTLHYDRDPFDYTPANGTPPSLPSYVTSVMTTPAIARTTTAYNNVRGFILTGKYPAVGSTSGNPCYGSDFAVSDIEATLNKDFNTFSFSNVQPFKRSGALIILEIHWQHHPLFLGTIFTNGGNRQNDPMLYLYAIFPVLGAESTATPNY